MMFKILTGLALALVLCRYGDAIKCIVCDSESDSTCAQADKLMDAYPLTDCSVTKPGADLCVTKTNVTDGKTVVNRDCASIKEDLEGIGYESCITIDGLKICSCVSDGCNQH